MRISIGSSWLKSEYCRVLLIAASLGLAGGLLEGAILIIIYMVPGWVTLKMRVSGASSEILWIAPTFYMLLFVVLALLLLAFASLRKRLSLFPHITIEVLAVFLFTLLSVYAVTYVAGRIHTYAAAVLSLGVAVQVSRWFLSRHERMMGILSRSLPVLLLLVVAAAGATSGLDSMRESSLIRQLPTTAKDGPNVLLIVLDTVRADHLSCYGYGQPTTPNIDAFAREGVRFENAISTSSWTLPSHATLLTGHLYYGDNTPVHRLELSKKHATLAEVMALQGYASAGFSANTYWITSISGFDRGFHHFEDYFGSVSDMAARTVHGKEFQRRVLSRLKYRDKWGRKRASDVSQSFLDWLDGQQSRPFFVFLNYLDTHSPYVSPSPHHTLFMDNDQRAREKEASFEPPLDNRFRGTAETSRLWIAGYDGALNYLDSELGKLFYELQRRDLLDNTLIILTSDHGEAFGEHGFYQHVSLHREVIHVPLILRLPKKIPGGLSIMPAVSTRDIPATITSMVLPDLRPVFPGESLAPFWSAQNPNAGLAVEPALSEFNKVIWKGEEPGSPGINDGWRRSFITQQWHCIIYESGKTELYDLRQDPKETNNLADTPAGRSIVEEFRAQLVAAFP